MIELTNTTPETLVGDIAMGVYLGPSLPDAGQLDGWLQEVTDRIPDVPGDSIWLMIDQQGGTLSLRWSRPVSIVVNKKDTTSSTTNDVISEAFEIPATLPDFSVHIRFIRGESGGMYWTYERLKGAIDKLKLNPSLSERMTAMDLTIPSADTTAESLKVHILSLIHI